MSLEEQLTYARWSALEPRDRSRVLDDVARLLGDAYDAEGIDETIAVGTIRHRPSGVRFVLIPGGLALHGMPNDALKRLKPGPRKVVKAVAASMQPAREVDVPPFLLAVEPLNDDELGRLLGTSFTWRPRDLRPQGTVPFEQLTAARAALAEYRWRLPSEAEWEYACRAGTGTLFPSGVDVPPVSPGFARNGFGLAKMGERREPCADGFHPTYEGAPPDASPWPGPGVVARGGSADLWSWQDCDEWVLTLCAYRAELTAEPYDLVALRPAMTLFDEANRTTTALAQRREAGVVTSKPPPSTPEWFRASPNLLLQNSYDRAVADLLCITRDRMSEEAALRYLGDLHLRHVVRWVELDRCTPAGTSITPPILDLVSNRATPGRSKLVVLLADILWQNHARELPLLAVTVDRDALRPLVDRAKKLEELAGDDDDHVRAAMPLLIALAGSAAEGLFLARLQKETDPSARASVLVALGIVGRKAATPDRARAVLERELASSDPVVRAGGAIGLGTLLGGFVSDDHRAGLEAARSLPKERTASIPWNHGELGRLAESVIRSFG